MTKMSKRTLSSKDCGAVDDHKLRRNVAVDPVFAGYLDRRALSRGSPRPQSTEVSYSTVFRGLWVQ